MCDMQGKGDKGRRLVIEKVHTTTSPDFYLAVAFSLTRAVCCVLQLGEKAHKSAMTAGETCQWMVRHFHSLASQMTLEELTRLPIRSLCVLALRF